MQIAKTSLVMALLLSLYLSACSSSSPVVSPGPLTPSPVLNCLHSPLLSRAEDLAHAAPGSDYVELLEVGRDALLARIHLIRSARKNIELQTMIWANDETGRYVMYELIQAARRGVQVRLLIDHLASEQHIEVASFLGYLHPNLQIRLFNPITGIGGMLKAEPSFLDKLNALVFKFDRLNRRMHNKTFIVDDLIGITGGRNYQNAYYDQATGLNYKDRDILMTGPVVAQMKRSFERYWGYRRAVPLTELADVKKRRGNGVYHNGYSRKSFALNGLFDELDEQADDPLLIEQRFVTPLQAVVQAEFIADDPHQSRWSVIRDNGRSIVTERLAELAKDARSSLTIQTPYLVLTSPAIKLFKKLRKQHADIDIRISTNSLAATDSWYVYALSYKQKKIYLDDLKFRIYEFKPRPADLQRFMPNYAQLLERATRSPAQLSDTEPQLNDEGQQTPPAAAEEMVAAVQRPYLCMHAKSLVVDGELSFVGSYNLDPRSENINTESGLVIRDRAFARRLHEQIAVDMQPRNAWLIAKKDRPGVVNEANEILIELSDLIPLVDLWPLRNTASSFELKPGRAPVEVGHPDFYDNYRDVGSFPEVGIMRLDKHVGVHGTKMFLGFFKPLL